jgi:hypothetical protein
MRRLQSICLIIFSVSSVGQKPFTPHVIYDSANKLYAVRATPKLFLKLVDSERELLKAPTYEGDYEHCKKCSVQKVPLVWIPDHVDPPFRFKLTHHSGMLTHPCKRVLGLGAYNYSGMLTHLYFAGLVLARIVILAC